MGHCDPQMSDFVARPPIGLNGGVYVKSRDTVNSGISVGDGCSSNGSRVACSYRQSWDAIVVYDGDGNMLWGSGGLLDEHTFFTVPIIQADGSMVIADDQHLYKFNPDFSVAWVTQSPGGSPIGLLPTPNGALVSATGSLQLSECWPGNCTLVFTIGNGGSGYTNASVVLAGGYCPGASAIATVSGGAVTAITLVSQGLSCDVAPDVIVLGDGAGAAVTAALGGAGPVNIYSATTGALLASTYLYQTGNSGPYYLTDNTPCLNDGNYPNRVYVLTNLSTDLSQGALWALDIDPANLTNPVSPAWSLSMHGPSGASPLCVGNNIYFDGFGITPGDNVGTTIFGVQDNGSSGAFLFQVPLGPGTGQVTANFAMDPRPEGGFWYQIQYDPSIYHRDSLTGVLIESVDISNLLSAEGAPQSTYWQAGVFAIYGSADQPYMIVPMAAYPAKAGSPGYLTMIDLNALQLVWALPLAGNDETGFDSPRGEAVLVLDSQGNPALAMSGNQSGAYFIASGAPNSTVSPSQLSFGPQAVGTSSGAQSVTLFNSASSVLTIGSISASGPFSATNSCGASLAPGARCTISVAFTPGAAGTLTGQLTISSNSQASPQPVPLDGVGAAATPIATLSASQLIFPAQSAGTVSPPQPVTLWNTGSVPLAISQITASGSTAQTNNCPTLLTAGASCIINVMLAAPLSGACSGTVTVADTASTTPQVISVVGACLPPPAAESALSISSLVFAPQTAGTVSQSQSVAITNVGTQSLSISSIAASGDAVQTNTCGAFLAVATGCTVKIAFTPSAIGPRVGAVTVTDSAPDSPHVISISGTGLANAVPIVNQPLLPSAVQPGAPGLTLLVNGSGFVPGSVVYRNGTPRVTQVISNTRLSASLTAADLSAPGTAAISVVNPAPGGGQSNTVWLPVGYPSPAPVPAVSTIPAGPTPSSLLTADFNNDGKLDLAVTNSGANTISIFPGKGDGTFAKAVSFATGNLPVAAATGDFNHDGILDLAIVNQGDNTVLILLGRGNRRFASQRVYPTGDQPVAIAVADLNTDGNLDLAVANQADNTISILLGNGDGTFAPQLAYPAGQRPHAVIAADFDGDGKPDLAVGNDITPGGTVTILLNHGDGSYLPGVPYSTGDTFSLIAADLNGDGIPDFAAANYAAQSLSIYLGSGDGTFTAGPFQATRLSPNLAGLAAADVNADGTLELLMGGNADIGLTAVENNNAGTFSVILQTGAVAQTTALAVGDFNNDGSIDAALASLASNTVSIILQSPALAFSSTNLNFGNVTVGGSATQSVNITNSGSAVLKIGTIGADGAFSQTNTCSALIAPGNSCTISVIFSPTATGTQTGSLSIASNIPGGPQTVSLSGIGAGFTASIVLLQNPAIGGSPLMPNTIALSSAAPSAGWTVSLFSSNPAIAQVPSSVTVAPGQTMSSAFTITTAAVSVSTPVTITASVNGYTASTVLTVNPIAVSIVLSSTNIVGGTLLSSNTITLTSPAPSGGLVFSLSSTNPAFASVPASVTVPAGATVSPGFNIATAVVASQTAPSIVATLSGVSGPIAYATLTLTPPSISSLILSPSRIAGGQSSNSNVITLSSPAPPGGTTIQLSCSRPTLVTVPSAVIVPANANSAFFTITTGYVTTDTSVTITATAAVSDASVVATLTVSPNGVAALNLSVLSTVGGTSLINSNTVTLLAPAPVGGAKVTLASSNPAVATLPGSVNVAGGGVTSSTFKIVTSAVTVSTPVTLTATYRGSTAAETLTVNPLAPASVTLGQSSVIGGKTVSGNFVTLNAPAHSGGVIVTLSSSNPLVTAVPATVNIAAGSRNSPKFNIVTTAVTARTTVTITAGYQGCTVAATLTVEP